MVTANYFIDQRQEQAGMLGAPTSKLKAPKEKILNVQEVDDIVCDNNKKNCVNNRKIKKYTYISDVVVVSETFMKNGKIYTEDTSKRQPNARIFKISESDELEAHIYDSEQFYASSTDWYHVETATSTIADYNAGIIAGASILEKIKGLLIATAKATTQNTYSGAGDGQVRNSGTVWSTTRSAGTGDQANAIGASITPGTYGSTSGPQYYIFRGFNVFDTSFLGSSASISAASLNEWVVSVRNDTNDGTDYMTLVQATQASTSTLATSDFGAVGTTEAIDSGERKDLSSVSAGAYLTFTFNATGRGFINKTGDTKIAKREGHDFANVDPASGVDKWNYLELYTSEQAGTANDPYLSVTYTAGRKRLIITD